MSSGTTTTTATGQDHETWSKQLMDAALTPEPYDTEMMTRDDLDDLLQITRKFGMDATIYREADARGKVMSFFQKHEILVYPVERVKAFLENEVSKLGRDYRVVWRVVGSRASAVDKPSDGDSAAPTGRSTATTITINNDRPHDWLPFGGTSASRRRGGVYDNRIPGFPDKQVIITGGSANQSTRRALLRYGLPPNEIERLLLIGGTPNGGSIWRDNGTGATYTVDDKVSGDPFWRDLQSGMAPSGRVKNVETSDRRYGRMIPIPVLRLMAKVFDAAEKELGCPAQFYVSDYEYVNPDPFLGVAWPELCPEMFVIAHWDEPNFRLFDRGQKKNKV
jgi:hypothetical protein